MAHIPGYKLTDAALYSFQVQDVFPDMVSFAAAIPDHLKPIFLIPSKSHYSFIKPIHMLALKIADDVSPTGHTPESDLFGVKTFTYEDNTPTVPSSEPGSIFDIDGADNKTHTEGLNPDENITPPSSTGYMTDVDMSEFFSYPYRTPMKVRKSSVKAKPVVIVRIALRPRELELKTPEKIQNNAERCVVEMLAFLPDKRKIDFRVTGGAEPHNVELGLLDREHVAMSCDCNFWRFNGPEFLAKTNKYMLGNPYGAATKAGVRDPEEQFFLCKHAYAVIKRFDKFMKEIESNLSEEATEAEVIEEVWDDVEKLEEAVNIPLEDLESDTEGLEPVEEDENEDEDEDLEQEDQDNEDTEPDEEEVGKIVQESEDKHKTSPKNKSNIDKYDDWDKYERKYDRYDPPDLNIQQD